MKKRATGKRPPKRIPLGNVGGKQRNKRLSKPIGDMPPEPEIEHHYIFHKYRKAVRFSPSGLVMGIIGGDTDELQEILEGIKTKEELLQFLSELTEEIRKLVEDMGLLPNLEELIDHLHEIDNMPPPEEIISDIMGNNAAIAEIGGNPQEPEQSAIISKGYDPAFEPSRGQILGEIADEFMNSLIE